MRRQSSWQSAFTANCLDRPEPGRTQVDAKVDGSSDCLQTQLRKCLCHILHTIANQEEQIPDLQVIAETWLLPKKQRSTDCYLYANGQGGIRPGLSVPPGIIAGIKLSSSDYRCHGIATQEAADKYGEFQLLPPIENQILQRYDKGNWWQE